MTNQEFIDKVLRLGYTEAEANDMIKEIEEDSKEIANRANQDASVIFSDLLQTFCPAPKIVY